MDNTDKHSVVSNASMRRPDDHVTLLEEIAEEEDALTSQVIRHFGSRATEYSEAAQDLAQKARLHVKKVKGEPQLV